MKWLVRIDQDILAHSTDVRNTDQSINRIEGNFRYARKTDDCMVGQFLFQADFVAT